jgi:hypothetical protein
VASTVRSKEELLPSLPHPPTHLGLLCKPNGTARSRHCQMARSVGARLPSTLPLAGEGTFSTCPHKLVSLGRGGGCV